MQKLKETGDSIYICQSEPDKACFQHDRAYGDFKNLPKRRTSDKVLRDKEFNIADNPKYDKYQYGLASVAFKIFDKKSALLAWSEILPTWATWGTRDKSTSGGSIKNENVQNQELVKKVQKQFIRKFEKPKVHSHSSFIDNIWGADLVDMQMKNKFKKGINFLLCVIDNFRKYAWAVSLKEK